MALVQETSPFEDLIEIVESGNLELHQLELFGDQDIDINFQNSKGNMVLHLAAQKNNIEVIQFILENFKRIDVNLTNKNRQTPLRILSFTYNNSLGIQLLLGHGAEVSPVIDCDDEVMSCLYCASLNEKLTNVEILFPYERNHKF